MALKVIEVSEILKQPGVYRIVCRSNGRFYIGSSINCRHRWSEHRSDLHKQRHGSVRLQKSYDKYGPEAFVFEVLEYVPAATPVLDLRSLEQKYLDETKAYDRTVGFNMSRSAFCSQFEITDEMRQKWSTSSQAIWDSLSPEERASRINHLNSVRPDNRGRKKSESFRKHRSELMKAMMADPNGPYTDFKKARGEWLAALNRSRRGRPISEVSKEKARMTRKLSGKRMGAPGKQVARSDGMVFNSLREAAAFIGKKAGSLLYVMKLGKTIDGLAYCYVEGGVS